MPPKGRPRKEVADDATQKKRDYQRNYQNARKSKITELTNDIKKCQEDLKKMKDARKQLKEQAKEDLRAFRARNQVKKGNKAPAPSVIPL
jgi:cytochrome c553